MLSEATNGIRPNATAGATTDSELPKTCALAVDPTLMASGAVAGEPAVPSPKKSRSFPAEITGRPRARTTFATAGISASVRGSACGPPPEKLMMSMPSRDGRLEGGDDLGGRARAAAAERQRDVEDAIVADVRARGDATDALTAGWQPPGASPQDAADARRDVGLRPARDDARDERAVEGLSRSSGRCSTPGPAKPRDDDDLRRRRTGPLREACREREARRVEERMLVVDAVVDDRDLDPFPVAPVSPANCAAPITARPLVQRHRVGEARIHVLGDAELEELRQLRVWQAHREPVQEHLIAARDPRGRKRALQIRDRARLGGVQPAR